MDIRPAGNRDAWDRFLGAVRPPSFLQSWAWGEMNRALGEDVIRLEAYDASRVVGVAQAVTVTARRGTFLHVPHGPVSGTSLKDAEGPKACALLLEALRAEAERRRLHFLRVSPLQPDIPEFRSLYRRLGFRDAPIHLHAERLWILDLSANEPTLLSSMRKTTRNLIRRSERENVRVRFSSSERDLPEFFRLYEETARRERFTPFSRKTLQEEFRAFHTQEHGALLGLAEQDQNLLAAALLVFTPWSGFYHHGASSRLRPHVPAAYALQWAAIKEAMRRGCAAYNFWGVVPGSPSRHPWAGLTLFKTGFGGRGVPLVPTQDLPLSRRYVIAYTLDRYRRWRRRLY